MLTILRLSLGVKASAIAVISASILYAIADSAAAVGVVYIEADDGSVGAANLSPLSEIISTDSAGVVPDGKWGTRLNLASGGRVYEASTTANPGDEDVAQITMNLDTADGLISGTNYDVYVAYWSANGQNWNIKAGFTAGNLKHFNRTQAAFMPTALPGQPASAVLTWTTAPTVTTEGDRTMFLGKVGTTTATGGQINVIIDDLPATGFPDSQGANAFNFRSWFDGLVFVEAGVAPTITATVNQSSGKITLNNATGQGVQITSYTINSPSGALRPAPTLWTSIANNFDGNDGSEFDGDIWNIAAPMMPFPTAATALTESEDVSGGGSGGALTPAGLDFGTPWIRTPVQDVTISVTLSDARVLNIVPTYAGTALIAGNFNGDSLIDLTDFGILRTNLHAVLPAELTLAEAYLLGDMNGSHSVNFDDFTAFRNAFNSAHGAGAFEAATGVPEPAAFASLIAGLLALAGWRGRRGENRLILMPQPIAAANHRYAVSTINRQHLGRVRGTKPMTGQQRFHGAMIVALACGFAMGIARSSSAQLVYVDALHTGAGANTGPNDATHFAATNADDGLWGPRTGFSSGSTFYQSGDGDGEDALEIFTTISGLLPNKLYNVYTNFWDATGVAQWNIRTGFQSGNLTLYSNPTDAGALVAQNAVLASSLTYSTAPTAFAEADRTMYAAPIGPAKANASGQITVYIDDLPSTIGVNRRTWYDGLSYQPATPILTLKVNTATGAVAIANDEAINFNVNYYEIRSAGVTGSLNLTNWKSFDDQEGIDPVGTGWDEAGGSSANILSEVGFQSLKTFVPSSSVSLGNAFSVGMNPNLDFYYAAPGGALTKGFVEYVTTPIVAGDYNGNGVVDAADYVVWRNGGPLLNEGNNPNTVDAGDYTFWRGRFGAVSNAASGAGASLVGGGSAIPEPATVLLIGPLAALWASSRRREQTAS